MKLGRRAETIAAQLSFQTVPINDLFDTDKTSWASFPSLPSHFPFSFYKIHVKTLQSTLLEIVFLWFHFRKFTEYDKVITLTAPENEMNRKHPK